MRHSALRSRSDATPVKATPMDAGSDPITGQRQACGRGWEPHSRGGEVWRCDLCRRRGLDRRRPLEEPHPSTRHAFSFDVSDTDWRLSRARGTPDEDIQVVRAYSAPEYHSTEASKHSWNSRFASLQDQLPTTSLRTGRGL